MLTHGLTTPELPARTVIVGAGGFVGGAIMGRLAAEGAQVLGLGRVEVDLLAPDAAERLASFLGPEDAVILVSAIAPVKTPAMLRDNIAMIEAMAAAVAKVKPAYLLNIGSDAVFADSDAPLAETSCRAPGSLHGIMHLTREVMLADAFPGPIATLRPTLIYGANDPHNGYGPNRFRRLAAAGEAITLFGEGEERRDHVLVDDVAELAAQIVLHRSTGSLNACTGTVISFREIAELVVAQLPHPVPIKGSPRSGPMPHNGYRPFDASATAEAFPDFRYTLPAEGIARVHAEAS